MCGSRSSSSDLHGFLTGGLGRERHTSLNSPHWSFPRGCGCACCMYIVQVTRLGRCLELWGRRLCHTRRSDRRCFPDGHVSKQPIFRPVYRSLYRRRIQAIMYWGPHGRYNARKMCWLTEKYSSSFSLYCQQRHRFMSRHLDHAVLLPIVSCARTVKSQCPKNWWSDVQFSTNNSQ